MPHDPTLGGHFGDALRSVVAHPTMENVVRAYQRADLHNWQRLRAAIPKIDTVVEAEHIVQEIIPADILTVFPGLVPHA